VVLSADECEQAGLDVVALPGEVQDLIREKAPDLANWLGNPVDFSIMAGAGLTPMELIEKMAGSSEIDFLICNVTEENPFDDFVWAQLITFEVDQYLKICSNGLKPLVATISNPGLGMSDTGEWRWKTLLEKRELLASKGIAAFSSVRSAATALSKLSNYYLNRRMRDGGAK